MYLTYKIQVTEFFFWFEKRYIFRVKYLEISLYSMRIGLSGGR